MEFHSTDKLRLNVLIRQPVQAIRINEQSMVLDALLEDSEISVQLHPSGAGDRYIRLVREFLSENLLGLPGGYPRHLGRWTRLGDTTNSLDKMLLLGDPEAVIAVACAPRISVQQLEAIWWSVQTPEIARYLLHHTCITESSVSGDISSLLVEHLPFEETPGHVTEIIALLLQQNLLNEDAILALWRRAQRRNAYAVGFVGSDGSMIPVESTGNSTVIGLPNTIQQLVNQNNRLARLLADLCTAPGQRWLAALDLALKKPNDEDVVIQLFRMLDRRFDTGIDWKHKVSLEIASELSESWADGLSLPKNNFEIISADLNSLLPSSSETARGHIQALLTLCLLGEKTLDPLLRGETRSGTVLRKQLEALLLGMRTCIARLRTAMTPEPASNG